MRCFFNKSPAVTPSRAYGLIAAEEDLVAARSRYSSAVAEAGLPHANIFGECEFVSRASVKLWREEGRRADKNNIAKTDNSQPVDPDYFDYADAVDQSVAAILAAHAQAQGRPAPSQASAEYKRTIVAAGEDHSNYQEQVAAISAAIVAVNRKMRGES